MKPKISIITICYNSETYIEETILSVITQSYVNKEYTVIDGGSCDRTIDIINKYKKDISYFVSEPDKGISDAFNKGIKAATGDLIGIINSDDLLAEMALERLAMVYSHDYDVYRGQLLIFDHQKGESIVQIPTMSWSKIPIRMKVAHPSTFISKRAYEFVKLDSYYKTNCKYVMDFDILLRLQRKGAKSLYLPYVLAEFRLGGVSQANDLKRKSELCRILRENGSNGFHVLIFNAFYTFRLWIKKTVSMLFGSLYFKIGSKI